MQKIRGMINTTNEQRIKNLSVPRGKVDVVLDTDAYNEIDDQFAISYLIKSKDRLNTKAIYLVCTKNLKKITKFNNKLVYEP